MLHERNYLYLDGQEERQLLIHELLRVRSAVLKFIEQLPADKHYEPRYQGWTPAALLGHLNLMDSAGLLTIKCALLGVRLPVSPRHLERVNGLTMRVFYRRQLSASIRHTRRNQLTLAEFIIRLPMARFTREVYHPALRKRLTVEQAVQAFFVHHWQHHLEIIQMVEAGVFYEPPNDPPPAAAL